MSNDLNISDLSYEAVYEKPIHFIWQDQANRWQIVVPPNCNTVEQADDLLPMINYYYRLPRLSHTAEQSQTILLQAHLPVVLVVVDDKPALALSGGGMDLSWQICEAYIRLGFYPPFHFELPRLSGYCNDPVTDTCEATANFVLSDALRRIESLQHLRC